VADEMDPGAVLQVDEDGVPTSVVLLQAINHGTEHRSQAATILTQLGIEPPPMDGWNFGDSEEQPG